ncbi:PREDICTED: zinc finger protein 26-like [Wasmannia auropunctata]|uniref:zinc finger protein 26-like n=1 Tax=Wasmannia auropunctata TaxID=64793 RepID=UPI0005F0AD0F|nr:PREDICTED: zinc finger protein 26-like [Wasmannia auropunctata]XP_011693100.1 PREDICTED: zinc finger protein 26-like [Wasmannia auropunctata]
MDEDVVEIENVESVCRLCLSTDEPRASVFATQEEEEEKDLSSVPLAAKIQACLSIQISATDKLSTLICTNCAKRVNQWHIYKESCLRSQDTLQKWLTNQMQLNPTVITIKDEPMDFDYEDNVEIISEVTNNLEQPHPPTNTVENNEPNEEVQDVTDNDANDIDNSGPEPISSEPISSEPIASEPIASESISSEPISSGPIASEPISSEPIASDSEPIASESISPEPIAKEKETNKEENQTDQPDPVILHSIKSEPQDEDDTDCTIEVESTNSSELLLNPMAVSGTEDTVMEADSTQKSNAAGAPAKKKFRRGPHTHFRGTRVFKQKCTHCQIFLHSKYTYMKHMKRFHSKENGIEHSEAQNDEEEMIEDLEDELVSMEKDSPLTPVQQEIISQLKTFSCYSCEQTFNDRRSTLSHIRQHMPDLRPYTCIACLTEFPDRSMYQLHCGASFECAMKIALVVPKHGDERYFTCNMCLRSMQGRKELLSHLSKHSDKQYEEMISPTRAPPKLKPMAPLPSTKNSIPIKSGPYKNGDPAHNHACDLCGMIYRYRPNMIKHKEMCMQLDPDSRTLYKCVHCFMTFLVFKKFHYHVTADHKKKDFTCAVCFSKFRSPSDFLTHHESHRATMQGNRPVQHDDASQSADQTALKGTNTKQRISQRMSSQKYSCPLCPQAFATRAELNEHRTLHLKMKIYSCAICRSLFSSAGALEIHMKDHGIDDLSERTANISCVEFGTLDEDVRIEKDPINASAISDPGTQNHQCGECGKVLTSYANLRRHAKIAHRNTKIYDCVECSRMFMRKDLYDYHMRIKHNSKKSMLQCPQCPKSFSIETNFNYHFRTAHLEKSQNGYACDICGKVFVEEASLKIHKGWHNRANSRLSTRFILGNQKASNQNAQKESNSIESAENSVRPARARKSFPNPPLQSPTKTAGNFQCQVCNDQFNDVTELRTHLWDVHCARNKQEKSFSNDELQCELCTNIFPDQATLASHMQWHKANPILSDIQKTFSCDVCGKSYSSKKVLWKHKRLHKATAVASIKFQSLARKPMATQFLCNFCRKTFSSSQSLQRHKLTFHSELQTQPRGQQQLYNSNRALSLEDEPRAKRMKFELENDNSQTKLSPFAMDFAGERRKPVMCHVCKKMFPNMSVLYKHKQTVHKARGRKDLTLECIPMSTEEGKFSCNICYKEFPGLSNLRQHFTIKHKKTAEANVSAPMTTSNDRLTISSPERPRDYNPEMVYNNVMYSCKLCKQCHVFNKESIMSHITNVHNAVYQADSKAFHREVNLGTYVVKDAIGATCPRCDVKYPNNRALKIHYIKFHENAD